MTDKEIQGTSKTTVTKPEVVETHNQNNSELEAVSINLPPFWIKNPITWFIQAEAVFDKGRIKSDHRKYVHLLAALPTDIIEKVLDIVQNPPDIELYNSLKSAIIKRCTISEEKRIKTLLYDAEMGDKIPSEFYRYLVQLGKPSASSGKQLIRNIWTQRIPKSLEIAILTMKEKPIEELIEIADQIYEAMNKSSVNTITEPQPSCSGIRSHEQIYENVYNINKNKNSEITELRKEINELKEMVTKLTTRGSRSPFRSATHFRRRSSSHNRRNSQKRHGTKQICWYHSTYGNKAKKCYGPCPFQSSATPKQQNDNLKN